MLFVPVFIYSFTKTIIATQLMLTSYAILLMLLL